MGYSIFYQRRFIKVGDKFIPIVQAGSNNCWAYNCWTGREIPEKNWSILSYPIRNRYLFTEDELINLFNSEYYEGYHHKTRNSLHDNFSRWLINGIKSAKTIEEERQMYNNLVLTFEDTDGYHSFDINSEEELHSLLAKYDDKELNIGFNSRDYNVPKITRENKLKDYSKGYYIIDLGRGQFFLKMKRHGFYYTSWKPSAKRFLTEAEGLRYLKKYENRLGKDATLTFIPPSAN